MWVVVLKRVLFALVCVSCVGSSLHSSLGVAIFRFAFLLFIESAARVQADACNLPTALSVPTS